jgi:hypothetical protein
LSLIRVIRTAAATLTRSLFVDETPTDATGSVLVAVTRLDGTVVTSGTATHPGPTGVYTFILPGQALVDHLDVTWTATLGGATVALTDRVEIVGGFMFGLAEARASDSSLSDPARYPTATLADKRIEVEQECERLTGQAWVPRFARAVLGGTGCDTLVLPHQAVRTVRSVKTRTLPTEAYTAVSTLANFVPSPGGILTRYDGGLFPAGYQSVVVEYEHGADVPPEDLKEAAMMRLRSRLNLSRSGVPDRVNSYTTPDGSTYRVSMPGRDYTGIPEVDAVYQRYSAPPVGFA